MTDEQATLWDIKMAIAELSEADRRGVMLAAAKLREVITLHNDHGRLALALVGAEFAAED